MSPKKRQKAAVAAVFLAALFAGCSSLGPLAKQKAAAAEALGRLAENGEPKEIVGSGAGGRVLHKDVVLQDARPGDYLMVFGGVRQNKPFPLSQDDIDHSKSEHAKMQTQLLGTGEGSVRALLSELVNESKVTEAKNETPPAEVDIRAISGKVVEYISDLRDRQQIILIVTEESNRAYFDSLYDVPPWGKAVKTLPQNLVSFTLVKKVNSDRNEIFCLNEDIQATKNLVKTIIADIKPFVTIVNKTGGRIDEVIIAPGAREFWPPSQEGSDATSYNSTLPNSQSAHFELPGEYGESYGIRLISRSPFAEKTYTKVQVLVQKGGSIEFTPADFDAPPAEVLSGMPAGRKWGDVNLEGGAFSSFFGWLPGELEISSGFSGGSAGFAVVTQIGWKQLYIQPLLFTLDLGMGSDEGSAFLNTDVNFAYYHKRWSYGIGFGSQQYYVNYENYEYIPPTPIPPEEGGDGEDGGDEETEEPEDFSRAPAQDGVSTEATSRSRFYLKPNISYNWKYGKVTLESHIFLDRPPDFSASFSLRDWGVLTAILTAFLSML